MIHRRTPGHRFLARTHPRDDTCIQRPGRVSRCSSGEGWEQGTWTPVPGTIRESMPGHRWRRRTPLRPVLITPPYGPAGFFWFGEVSATERYWSRAADMMLRTIHGLRLPRAD